MVPARLGTPIDLSGQHVTTRFGETSTRSTVELRTFANPRQIGATGFEPATSSSCSSTGIRHVIASYLQENRATRVGERTRLRGRGSTPGLTMYSHRHSPGLRLCFLNE